MSLQPGVQQQRQPNDGFCLVRFVPLLECLFRIVSFRSFVRSFVFGSIVSVALVRSLCNFCPIAQEWERERPPVGSWSIGPEQHFYKVEFNEYWRPLSPDHHQPSQIGTLKIWHCPKASHIAPFNMFPIRSVFMESWQGRIQFRALALKFSKFSGPQNSEATHTHTHTYNTKWGQCDT